MSSNFFNQLVGSYAVDVHWYCDHICAPSSSCSDFWLSKLGYKGGGGLRASLVATGSIAASAFGAEMTGSLATLGITCSSCKVAFIVARFLLSHQSFMKYISISPTIKKVKISKKFHWDESRLSLDNYAYFGTPFGTCLGTPFRTLEYKWRFTF